MSDLEKLEIKKKLRKPGTNISSGIEDITKRYSKKKIQRLLIHVLTNTTRDDYEELFGTKVFRVLAVKSEKSGLIREINKEEKITLFSVLNSSNSMYFAQDIKVARIYNLIAGKPDIFREKIELV